jgi:hypothetical protein
MIANTLWATSCQRSYQRTSSMPPVIWVRSGSVVLPLQQPYDSPYAVFRHSPNSFTVYVGNQDEVISTSRHKPGKDNKAKLGIPCRCGRLPNAGEGEVAKPAAHCHGGSAHSQASLVCRPAGASSISATSGEDKYAPRYSFSPILKAVFCMRKDILSSAASTDAVPTVPPVTASKIGPLTLLPPTPVLGRDPCGSCLSPCCTCYSTGNMYHLYTSPRAGNVRSCCQHQLPVYRLCVCNKL